MASNPSFRPRPGSIPDQPGVYRFRDERGVVIYVGKALSVRSRLNSYFADPHALHPRTRAMVETAAGVDWVTVANEVEALQVEFEWIKQYDPRFNVRYRDDKSYPFLAVTLGEEFPRISVVRGAKKKGVRYFGPYTHAWAIRETVDQLLRVFPIRSCSKGVFNRHQRMERPCLLGDIGKCAAPCTGAISPDEHRALADDLCRFIGGRTDKFVARVEREMRAASDAQEYEQAARLRDDLAALRRALEKSAVVLPDSTNADVIGLADDELQASIQVFHVRGGRVTGQRSYIVEKGVDELAPTLIEQFLLEFYGEQEIADQRHVPREVLVSEHVTNPAAMSSWLATIRDSGVKLSTPVRGSKRALMETVKQNAAQALTLHKIRRAGDLTARSQALSQLQEYLDLDDAPLRIECIDISGTFGTNLTASIVVFEAGLAKKSDYRKYKIGDNQDDLASMYEAVSRRFRGPAEPASQSEEVNAEASVERSRYRTSLLVVDGAYGQVKAAAQALSDNGVTDVAICGLAKRLEEVWLPDQEDPVILPRRSEALYLLQRLRDEAHRFALRYHRQRRAASATTSALDAVPGLGPARRRELLKHFGPVRKIKQASADEITQVAGIGPVLAQAIVRSLVDSGRIAGVNVTTGEVFEEAT